MYLLKHLYLRLNPLRWWWIPEYWYICRNENHGAGFGLQWLCFMADFERVGN